MRSCPNGHEVGDNVKFCPECGAEIIDNGAKFCAKCGNERGGAEKYCSQCGSPYDQIPSSSDIQVSNSKSKKGWLVAVVISLLALAIGGAAWYYWGKIGNPNNKYSLEELAKTAVKCDYISDFHEGLAFIVKDNKLGVMNKMGNIIVEPTYDSEMIYYDSYFNDGIAKVRRNGKYGFIDKDGKEIIPCVYEDAMNLQEGLIAVKKNEKYGYIDKNGQIIIPFIYESANDFSEGMTSVKKNGKYGYINKKGETVIPFTYDYAESFNGNVAIVNNDCIIDKEGKVIKQFKSGMLRDFSEGLAIYENEENDEIRYGFVDESGNLVIPRDFYSYRGIYNYFNKGYAIVYKYEEEKFGVIDKTGKTIIPYSFDFIEDDFSEGLFRVNKDGKIGFYDNHGKCVIPCKYDAATPFSEELASVKEGDLWRYIDRSGQLVIPSIYDDAHSFSEGLAVVQKDGIYGFVDKKGNSTFDIQNEEVKSLVQSKIQEKEEIRKQEERQAEEERIRLEEERRKGVERIVILSYTKDGEDYRAKKTWSGNYGANVWGGMWHYDGYVMSDFITIPNGKVWIYNRIEIESGNPGDIGVLYYSRDSRRSDDVRSFDNRFDLKKGDMPIIRAGDRIILSFNPWSSSGTKTIRVYFKEKDEDLVF